VAISCRSATDLAGFGGDVRYVRTKLNGAYYYPVAKGYTISATGEAGQIGRPRPAGQYPGSLVRRRRQSDGFATAGIGPRDIVSGDALGGNMYYVGSLALNFPLGLPQEFGVSGRVFSDIGDLWQFDLLQQVRRERPLESGCPRCQFHTACRQVPASPGNRPSIRFASISRCRSCGRPSDKSEFFRISFGHEVLNVDENWRACRDPGARVHLRRRRA